MPFSRYQIRNEFSLADPELYKSADKDDPEALLEGVAMAGLVGVLRQLGDLAEFAAEIFHGLHEEVMVTAARGNGLLVRVQQVESDFPSIERSFLSQTGHSAFFSSSGISWHPIMQTEQNLISKGDLPRFVMDSYEESRGPPRLFLLDKFDVAGAGACLKRYTDPSFYKMEASSYEMMSAEAQRDKKIRKTKKKGSRLKNGETPDVFQSSHVKLHQLLLEERAQNGASEPARHVKLKKREIKFPFDTENGKGYMEKLLHSPPEDKLVHEVSVGYSDLEPLEGTLVNSLVQNGSSYESPTVDKTVSREHLDHLENSSIELQADDIEDKHISVDVELKEVGYRSDDVASETENYMDALTTMESEIETDAELRVANSDPVVKQEIEQIKSQFSDAQSASDDENSPIMNKITTFSYSDTSSTSPENMSPHGINSQAFASTEIPFRPRVSPNEVPDSCIEVSDNKSLPADSGAIIEESTSKESDRSEMLSNNWVDVYSPTRKEEIEIDPDDIIASTVDNEDDNSNSAPVISADVQESKSELAESNVSYTSEDETELEDRETISFDLQENKAAMADDEKEFNKRDPESVNSEAKDLIPVFVPDDVDSNEIQDLSTCVDIESKRREIQTVDLDKNEDNGVSTTEEPGENGPVINEYGVGLRSSESVEKESSDHPKMQILDSILNSFSGTEDNLNENAVDNLSTEKEAIESYENKELSELLVISPELDLILSASSDHLRIQAVDVSENDVENSSANLQILQDETISVIDPSGQSIDVSSDVDFQPVNHVLIDQSNAQFQEDAPDSPMSAAVQKSKSSKSDDQHDEIKSQNQVDQIDKLEKRVDQLETVDSQNHLIVTHSDSDLINQESYSLEQVEKVQDHEEPSMADLSQPSTHINVSGFNMIPQLSPSNMDKMPPLPPLPPMEWRMGKLQSDSLFSYPGGGQHDIIHQFPLASLDLNENATNEKSEHDVRDLSSEEDGSLGVLLPGGGQHGIHQFPPALQVQNENITDEKSEHDHEDLNIEEDGKIDVPTEVNAVKFEETVVPQPSQNDNKTDEKSEHDCEDLNTEEEGKLDVPTEVNAVKFEEKFVPQPPQNDNKTDEKLKHDYEDLNIEEDGKLDVPTEVNAVKFEDKIVPQPSNYMEQSENASNSGQEIIRPLSTSSLPLIDNEKPNGIRPIRIQRPRSPLIDAVAAHDKSKLRKASERAMPVVPKEEERDTLLEQIRAKSFNLKPAVQTRPSIQGPSTNLRVAAILEKANAIRHAFAGSDDDEDDSDSWSDS